MTSYRCYMVNKFPKFTKAKPEISNQVQIMLTGTSEKIRHSSLNTTTF